MFYHSSHRLLAFAVVLALFLPLSSSLAIENGYPVPGDNNGIGLLNSLETQWGTATENQVPRCLLTAAHVVHHSGRERRYYQQQKPLLGDKSIGSMRELMHPMYNLLFLRGDRVEVGENLNKPSVNEITFYDLALVWLEPKWCDLDNVDDLYSCNLLLESNQSHVGDANFAPKTPITAASRHPRPGDKIEAYGYGGVQERRSAEFEIEYNEIGLKRYTSNSNTGALDIVLNNTKAFFNGGTKIQKIVPGDSGGPWFFQGQFYAVSSQSSAASESILDQLLVGPRAFGTVFSNSNAEFVKGRYFIDFCRPKIMELKIANSPEEAGTITIELEDPEEIETYTSETTTEAFCSWDEERGTVTGGCGTNEDDPPLYEITLKAEPSEGFKFKQWQTFQTPNGYVAGLNLCGNCNGSSSKICTINTTTFEMEKLGAGCTAVYEIGSEDEDEENSSEKLLGDLNSDGEVNFADFLVLAKHYGDSPAERENGDLNDDNTVGFPDFLLLAKNFGRTIGGSTTTTRVRRLKRIKKKVQRKKSKKRKLRAMTRVLRQLATEYR